MKNRVIVGAIGFAAAMACGVYFSLQATELTEFADMQTSPNSRIPAAIRHDLDFSGLQGADLIKASRKRLLTAARVILQDDQQGIELGHFVMRDDSGRRQLACDYYDQVQMTFAAEGIADSGEKPEMQIDGPCRADQDITQIAPIWIPVARILAQQPGNLDLTFDGGDVHFQFANMTGNWPLHWTLESIRLYNSGDASHEVTISHQDAHDIINQAFELNWQTTAANSSTGSDASSSEGASSSTRTNPTVNSTNGTATGTTTETTTN